MSVATLGPDMYSPEYYSDDHLGLPVSTSIFTLPAMFANASSSTMYTSVSSEQGPLSASTASMLSSSATYLSSSLVAASTSATNRLFSSISMSPTSSNTFYSTLDATTEMFNATVDDDDKNEKSSHNKFILPLYQKIIWSFIFGSMVFVAAGGNIIVIWIVMTNKRMRTVTNYFLVNLSVADIMLSTLNVIFNFITMLNSDWPFGKLYCKVSNFISILSVAASVFTLMAISIDRYLAIVHPLKPRMSRTVTLNIIVCIWIAASVLSLPNIIYSAIHVEEFTDGDSRKICYLKWPEESNSKYDYIYNLTIMLTTYMLPMMAMIYAYFRVGRELWGSQSIGECTAKQMESIKSKRKIVKMMMIVVTIFAIGWAPYHIFFLLPHHIPEINKSKYVQQIYLVIYWLAMSNSVYNPIVYCWMNSRFRQGFRNVFCCTCLRKKENPLFEKPRYQGAARYSCASEAPTDMRVRFNGNGNITLQATTSLTDTSAVPAASCSTSTSPLQNKFAFAANREML